MHNMRSFGEERGCFKLCCVVLLFVLFVKNIQAVGFIGVDNIPAFELNILHDLFDSTSGRDWLHFAVPWNFTGEHNPCADGWEGIECTCKETNLPALFPFVNDTIPGYLYYYDDGTGVIGTPCHISKISLGFSLLHGTLPSSLGDLQFLTRLHLESNILTGSIPSSFGSLSRLQYLMVYNNFFTGTVPTTLGKITTLQILGMLNNSLTGPIPTSLGNFKRMTNIFLSNNFLTGMLPTSLGLLTELEYLLLYNNRLSGTLPTSLGLVTRLTSIGLFLNSFTGAIPSALGCLAAMQHLHLFSNHLTSTIPSSLGLLTNTISLLLEDNQLEGSIPSSLGALVSMTSMWLFANALTNTVPTTLRNLKSLEVLLLHHNSLSGNLDGLFDPQQQLGLLVVGASNNLFTGTVPMSLFSMQNLTAAAMVGNCMSGTLSSEICQLTSLQVLALDGVHTAQSCQDRFFPHDPLMTAYGLSPSKSMRGTIPSCLFTMPHLTTLHLSGNGFTGSIASDVVGGAVLTDLSLAHNILTGPIPDWVQQHTWHSLNLGYNRLSGTLASSLVVGANSSLALNVNRLSGNIPSSLRYAGNITVLEGNFFACNVARNSLPINDPNVSSYHCGSNDVNTSLAVWVVVLVCCVLTSCFYFLGWLKRGEIHHGGDLQGSRSAFNLTGVELQRSFLKIVQLSSDGDVFSFALDGARRLVAVTTALVCLILLPTYAALSAYYRNRNDVYTWAVSAPFLSGSPAATVLVVVWTLVGGIVSVAAAHHIPSPSISISPSVDITNTSNSSQLKEGVLRETETVADACRRVAAWTAYVIANLTIMGGINLAYVVVVTTGKQSALATTGLELFLGAIKGAWNGLVLPSTFIAVVQWVRRQSVRDTHEVVMGGSTKWMMFHSMVVCNNILLPSIVVALVDPNCFYNMLVQAPSIEVAYSYTYCSEFYLPLSDCVKNVEYYVSTTYLPPFIYNYQCTAALLANYAAVYVYSMTFISFVMPVANWLYYGDNIAASFRPERFTIQLVNLLAILVTFGIVFPPLAVVVVVAVGVDTYYAQALMVRYVRMAKDGEEEKGRLAAMEAAGVLMTETLVSSLWLLMPLSASFNAFFVFDILGDKVGWYAAIGGLVTVMAVLPLLMWGVYVAWRRFIVAAQAQSPFPPSSDSSMLSRLKLVKMPSMVIVEVRPMSSEVKVKAHPSTVVRPTQLEMRRLDSSFVQRNPDYDHDHAIVSDPEFFMYSRSSTPHFHK